MGRVRRNTQVEAVGYTASCLNEREGRGLKPRGGILAAPLKKLKTSCRDILS